MALALRKPSFRNESAGFEWRAEVAIGYLSNAVDDPVDDLLVLEYGHVEWVDPWRGRGRTSALNRED